MNQKEIAFHIDSTQEFLDTMFITYKVLPYPIDTIFSIYTTSSFDEESKIIDIRSDYSQDLNDPIIRQGVNYNGSFARGVSVGNNQDLVLNSNLNLELLGDLGGGLNVRAVISDDNLPIQAEGSTQVLQEFDKVYMEVNKDKTTLKAGDFDEAQRELYFVNYAKKAKGVSLSTGYAPSSKNYTANHKGTFAVSRGKFTRQTILAGEGNQGPYRLTGGGNQGFYIILSGSEKVFLDGVLMSRGFDKDYTIDYNSAELTFSTQQLITRDSRILIEYEYADQSYLRSIVVTDHSINTDNWTHRLHFYQEQDSKSVLGTQSLDTTDIAILSAAGDNNTSLYRSSLTPLASEEYNEQENYYILEQDGSLTYTKNKQQGLYRATFTYIGSGNGAYIIDNTINANGRAYLHVGSGNGDYEPIVPLTSPTSNQYLTLVNNYQDSFLRFKSELVLSNADKNRFSTFDDANNTGISWFGAIEKRIQSIAPSKFWTLRANTEIKHKNFSALNPYRDPEFNRNWNVLTNLGKTELLSTASLAYQDSTRHNLSYTLQRFDQAGFYSGYTHTFAHEHSLKLTTIAGTVSLLTSRDSTSTTRFFRPKLDITQALGSRDGWKLQGSIWQEDNNRKNTFSNILEANSQSTDFFKATVFTPSSTVFSSSVYFQYRTDQLPDSLVFVKAFDSREVGTNGALNFRKSGNISYAVKYRTLLVDRPDLIAQETGKTLLSNINYSDQLLRNTINLQSFLEYSTGQQAIYEDQYLKVQQGTGIYQWNDQNQDSIQQLTEFVESIFIDQADYIKIAIFNNTFTTVQEQQWTQSLSFDPEKLWQDTSKSDFKKLAGRFFWSSRIKTLQKSNGDQQLVDIFKTLDNLDQDSLILRQSNSEHFLHFNRKSLKYDIRLGRKNLFNRRTQSYGVDQIEDFDWYATLRLHPLKTIDITVNTSKGKLKKTIETAAERAVDMNKIEGSLTASYLPNPTYRLNLTYTRNQRNNVLDSSPATSSSDDLELTSTWRKSSDMYIQCSTTYAKVKYSGPANDFLKLDMLQGLQAGNNFLWRCSITRKLNKTLELSLDYNGRKTGENRIIHQGNTQLRALF